jgi:DnaK suppressor protein
MAADGLPVVERESLAGDEQWPRPVFDDPNSVLHHMNRYSGRMRHAAIPLARHAAFIGLDLDQHPSGGLQYLYGCVNFNSASSSIALSKKQLDRLKRAITKRREALLKELLEDAGRTREEVYAALAGPVPDTADQAVADLLSDLDQAELSRDLQELRDLDTARARLADGTFGRCVDCGQEIEPERLNACPTAVCCFDCQRIHERTHIHSGESSL